MSRKDLLIDRKDINLPPLRSDVEMIPVSHDGDELIYFHDPQGYMPSPFVMDRQVAALLPMLNGAFSIQDIWRDLKRYGNEVDEEQLLTFFKHLDEARLLLSPWFRHYKTELEEQFEQNQYRPPVCAGQSYPLKEKELRQMLETAFSMDSKDSKYSRDSKDSIFSTNSKNTKDSNYSKDSNVSKDSKAWKDTKDSRESKDSKNCKESPQEISQIKALYAPHIDLRVGIKTYIPAFRELMKLKPSRVVLLATSHYAGSYYPLYDGYPFIATRKHFQTPFGTVQTDAAALSLLEHHAEETGCSFHDRAHRNEHSIELHLLFLQYIWKHSFRLVPILVGSLEEIFYKADGDIGSKVNAMARLLGETFGDDSDTLFLVSGDFAHVGRKFGDQRPASEMFDEVKRFDRKFIRHAEQGNADALLDLMKEDMDAYRICGFPPLYTALKALSGVRGQLKSYDLWDERERESAVSFGSLVLGG